jgi:hypothetical protein
MSNNNYTATAGRNFSTGGYYQAPDSGTFNTLFPADGSFAAFCTFIMRGGVQTLDVPDAIFLWGNLANQSGWSLQLQPGIDNALTLAATIGSGGAIASATAQLFDGANPGLPTPIERLLQAGIWYDGTNVYLTINGVIAAYTATLLPAPSALPATLGAGNSPISNPAIDIDICNCGFYNEQSFAGAPLGDVIGQFAGEAFNSSRETLGASNFITPSQGLDWTHRYDFATAAPSTAASITKTSSGSVIAQPATAPASLPDLGGFGVQNPNLATNAAVALAKQGANPINLFTRKNVDWYSGARFLTPQGPA